MGIHDGHRERLKKRFEEHGLESFNDINSLELLLFFAIPRKDTNETAHALLDRFGSLSGVFGASVQELMTVQGVGLSAALLISLVPQLMKRSMQLDANELKVINSSTKAGTFLLPRFAFETKEKVLLLSLDAKKRLIACDDINSGVVNAVDVSIRKIVETAIRRNASSAILAHNHPDGFALPSREDEVMTGQIIKALKMVDIPLVDHIIVAGDDFVSFADSGFMSMIR